MYNFRITIKERIESARDGSKVFFKAVTVKHAHLSNTEKSSPHKE